MINKICFPLAQLLLSPMKMRCRSPADKLEVVFVGFAMIASASSATTGKFREDKKLNNKTPDNSKQRR
jgi:hypothetical protein